MADELEEEEKLERIEKLSIKLKTMDKYNRKNNFDKGIKMFPETI